MSSRESLAILLYRMYDMRSSRNWVDLPDDWRREHLEEADALIGAMNAVRAGGDPMEVPL